MSKKFKPVITREENWYVGHFVELDVVSQGRTFGEAEANLNGAAELYIESFSEERP